MEHDLRSKHPSYKEIFLVEERNPLELGSTASQQDSIFIASLEEKFADSIPPFIAQAGNQETGNRKVRSVSREDLTS